MKKMVCWEVVLMGKWTEELYDDCTIDDDGSISHLGLGFNEDCYFSAWLSVWKILLYTYLGIYH